MRSAEKLINIIIGDKGGTSFLLNDSNVYFNIYRVELPMPSFSGIPTKWIFIIQKNITTGTRESTHDLHQSVFSILDTYSQKNEFVLFISDDQFAHLEDEFGDDRNPYMYFIDAFRLSSKEFIVQPRLTPFASTIRRKLSINTMIFSPYQFTPVEGWQFFGRRKQLQKLVYGNENYVIVGARRAGKTSLMKEAFRRLQENKENTLFVDVQNCHSAGDVINRILQQLSMRDLTRSVKQHNLLGESILENVIRRMSSTKRLVLFLDEIGNVISRMPAEDWSFFGVFRKFSNSGRLRVIMSCFQEFYIRQQTEFSGPLVNYGQTMRIKSFERHEVEELVLSPLRFWSNIEDKDEQELINTVTRGVGYTPFLLQHFCSSFFEKISENTNHDLASNILQQARSLLNFNIVETFDSGIKEVFFGINNPLLQYIFLKRCHDAYVNNDSLESIEFNFIWLKETLLRIKLHGKYSSYQRLFESLEMHGLCSPITDYNDRMTIAAPIIYQYIIKTSSILDMLSQLEEDILSNSAYYIEYSLEKM